VSTLSTGRLCITCRHDVATASPRKPHRRSPRGLLLCASPPRAFIKEHDRYRVYEPRAERSWRAGTRGGGYAVKSVGSSFTCILGRLANACRHAVSMPLLFAECHIGIIMHCAPAVQHVLQYVGADVEAHEKPKSILRAALSRLLAGHGEVAAPRPMGVT